MTNPNGEAGAVLDAIVAWLGARERLVITSHVRPDGDSIGSALGLALALTAMGKAVEVVNRDPAPEPLRRFPGTDRIRLADHVDGPFDGAVVLECSEVARTGLSGLDRYPIVNIDHHPGNGLYGVLNWYDTSVSACAEMVYAVIRGLGAPLGPEAATHLYLGILTDTGSFHYSGITARTFEICRALVEAGADPPRIARMAYDSSTLGKVRLLGAVLGTLEMEADDRLAVLRIDPAMAAAAGGSYDDTEGTVNLPLSADGVGASVFFKELGPAEYRVSLRSKGAVDVGAVAKRFGGGGHKNAAGCTIGADYAHARALIVEAVRAALAAAGSDADTA